MGASEWKDPRAPSGLRRARDLQARRVVDVAAAGRTSAPEKAFALDRRHHLEPTMNLMLQPRRTAACLTLFLLALAAAASGCERRPTDPQAPATTAPAPGTGTPDAAMPPASAASQ
jgi:hypothetical protein